MNSILTTFIFPIVKTFRVHQSESVFRSFVFHIQYHNSICVPIWSWNDFVRQGNFKSNSVIIKRLSVYLIGIYHYFIAQRSICSLLSEVHLLFSLPSYAILHSLYLLLFYHELVRDRFLWWLYSVLWRWLFIICRAFRTLPGPFTLFTLLKNDFMKKRLI